MNKLISVNQKGFTLVEVLAALTIIGIVFSILLPIFSHLFISQNNLSAQTEVYILAKGKLEEITSKAERGEEGDFAEPWNKYHWRYQEEYISEDWVKQLLVVKWSDQLHERKYTLTKIKRKD